MAPPSMSMLPPSPRWHRRSWPGPSLPPSLSPSLSAVRVTSLPLVAPPAHGDINANARSSAAFTKRSFRHCQTLRCIAAPKTCWEIGHLWIQELTCRLVIRKLLWEKVPSEQVAPLMVGRDTEELKGLLLEGIEIVAAGGGGEKTDFRSTDGGPWKRIVLAPGWNRTGVIAQPAE